MLLEAGDGGNLSMWDAVIENVGSDVRACRYDRAGLVWSDP